MGRLVQVATFNPYGVIFFGLDEKGYHTAIAQGKDALARKVYARSEEEAYNHFLNLVEKYKADLIGKLEGRK